MINVMAESVKTGVKTKVHHVRKMKVGRGKLHDALVVDSGRIYTLAVVWFWRHVRRHGVWLSQYAMQHRLNNGQPTILHSQSAQKAVECFYAALKTWRSERKTNPSVRAPYKTKRFFKVVWKKAAISLRGGRLRLSNAQGTEPLVLDWKHPKPVQVELGWDGTQYEIRATYESEPAREAGETVASCDLGEVHPAVIGTRDFHLILNGGELRSKRRYREKLKAALSARIDRKKKGGSRRKRLIESKKRKLIRIDHQIRDIEHKLTTAGINTLKERGVGTLAIGDMRDIRTGYDKGAVQNQRIHQAPIGRFRQYLTYKAERLGWLVPPPVNEAWTSQECPRCGKRNVAKGRVYRCAGCGFVGHRDVVGQVNILEKYLGEGRRVVGAMASPIGVRWKPHMRCRS
jgi:putative transposase